MKLKKIGALLLAVAMSVSMLAGCGNSSDSGNAGNAGTSDTGSANAGSTDTGSGDTGSGSTEVQAISLKVWVPEEDVEITRDMCDSFQAVHPEYDITWDIAVVGIDESSANLTTDADSAADVFYLPSGSIVGLTDAGLLLPIAYDIDNVKKLYGEASIEACSRDGIVYGIPFAPNSWFMYYNKTMFTEDEVNSLETMLAKDLGDDVQNFSCTISNSWYISAFFYAAGCELFGPDGMDPTSCTWNGENGVKAAEYLVDLVNNPKYVEDKDGIAGSLFQDGKLAALCSGDWSYPSLKEALGDDLGAAPLPTVNINGTDARLSNFMDFKCIAVKSSTAQPLAAQQFAEWLGNEENQLTRYVENSISPAVLSLQNNAEVQQNVATLALIAQTGYATPQPSISQVDAYWTPAQALGEGIVNGEYTKANVQGALDQLVQAIVAQPE